MALERMGLRPEEAAYVGDSPEDVEMARGAGVFAIGIPGAFPNREALVASRPDFLAESLQGRGGASPRLSRTRPGRRRAVEPAGRPRSRPSGTPC